MTLATRSGFPMTGAGAGLTDYAPELHLTAGRMFQPGLLELIASNYCARQYQHFSLGDKRLIQGVEWLVVGNFDLGRGNGSLRRIRRCEHGSVRFRTQQLQRSQRHAAVPRSI